MIQPVHYAPPQELADYVSFYGFMESEKNLSEPYISPPLGLSGFIIMLHGTNRPTINGVPMMKHPHVATGQATAPVVGEIIGRNKTIMVFMPPLGMYQLFGCTMAALTNTSLPLSEFLGQEEYETLMEQLLTVKSNEEQIAVLNAFFLAQKPVFTVAEPIIKALDYIHERRGNVSISDIETACFITRRSLERHFQVCVGLSPKAYAKIYRFKCFMNFLQENPQMTWMELCERQGFFDHSHLTRYFTDFLGIKPHELVNVNLEFINFLLQE